jgi:jumonji domain-containing protein 7
MKRPSLMSGAAADWPARTLWSPEYLTQRFGERRILVGPIDGDGKSIAHDARRGIAYDRVPLADFLRAPRGYAIFPLDEFLPELARDLGDLPSAPWQLRKLWLSPAGVGSPLHQDLTANLYAQIVGRKQVTLFHPRDGRNLYRHPLLSRLPNFARVDAEAPDHARFPRFRRAQPLRLTLQAGDLLYIPPLWWHQMTSLDFSISVSHWWAGGLARWAVRAALFYKQLRALRY